MQPFVGDNLLSELVVMVIILRKTSYHYRGIIFLSRDYNAPLSSILPVADPEC